MQSGRSDARGSRRLVLAGGLFWRTTLDPGNDGLNTASVGPVMGFRIGDLPRGESIDVIVSAIDGGEFVLQSTGTIRLFPS